MSEMVEIVGTLEDRLKKLLLKFDLLEQSKRETEQKLEEAQTTIAKQSEEINSLKKQCETLRITQSLLGSEEYKRDTKQKINSLIREIDYCIAQLSD